MSEKKKEFSFDGFLDHINEIQIESMKTQMEDLYMRQLLFSLCIAHFVIHDIPESNIRGLLAPIRDKCREKHQETMEQMKEEEDSFSVLAMERIERNFQQSLSEVHSEIYSALLAGVRECKKKFDDD